MLFCSFSQTNWKISLLWDRKLCIPIFILRESKYHSSYVYTIEGFLSFKLLRYFLRNLKTIANCYMCVLYKIHIEFYILYSLCLSWHERQTFVLIEKKREKFYSNQWPNFFFIQAFKNLFKKATFRKRASKFFMLLKTLIIEYMV